MARRETKDDSSDGTRSFQTRGRSFGRGGRAVRDRTPLRRLSSLGLWLTKKIQTSSSCRILGDFTEVEAFLLHRSKTLDIPGELRGYIYFLAVSTYRAWE